MTIRVELNFSKLLRTFAGYSTLPPIRSMQTPTVIGLARRAAKS